MPFILHDHTAQGLPHDVCHAIVHKCADTRPDFDQPLFLQRLDCLADDRPADPKFLAQFALRWQAIPGVEMPVENKLFNSFYDLFIQSCLIKWLKHASALSVVRQNPSFNHLSCVLVPIKEAR